MKQLFKKFIAYHTPELFDSKGIEHIKEVYAIRGAHEEEIQEMWRQTNSQSRLKLATAFREELEKEWSKEASELLSEDVFSAMKESVITYIEMAYAVGYMRGKLWISQEHLLDYTLLLGDKLARDIKTTLKGAKSRGLAFSCAFDAVAVQGFIFALGQYRQRIG